MEQLKYLNLLFLEDNQEFAENTCEFLNLYFKNIFHAVSINEALELYHKEAIHVIISDIKVQDENGLDFIHMIRKENKKVPIIVLSAHKDTDFLFKAIPLNILSYEMKPLKFDNMLQLLQKISNLFDENKFVGLIKNLRYNYSTRELFEDKDVIHLTKKEILFIELLLKNKSTLLTDELIQKEVYKEKEMSSAAIKNLIFRLRKKVKTDFITTLTNVGYKLSV